MLTLPQKEGCHIVGGHSSEKPGEAYECFKMLGNIDKRLTHMEFEAPSHAKLRKPEAQRWPSMPIAKMPKLTCSRGNRDQIFPQNPSVGC